MPEEPADAEASDAEKLTETAPPATAGDPSMLLKHQTVLDALREVMDPLLAEHPNDKEMSAAVGREVNKVFINFTKHKKKRTPDQAAKSLIHRLGLKRIYRI